MQSERIPFEVAIAEPRLLKPTMDGMGMNQRVMLKTMYGCKLDDKVQDEFGLTEIDYWAAGQGYADFDELGYIKTILPHPPYVPKEYRECWIVAGRRAGKTDRIAATITAYEATLGGHEYRKRKGRPAICFQIAQDTRMAKFALHSINATLESMDFIFNGGDAKKNRIKQVTADRIDLWNEITISVLPPTLKGVRGYDNPMAVLDEVGVWYQDSDSANPDYEIYRAVSPGQATFESPKIVGISSPWNRAGILYQFYEAGTDGCKVYCADCRLNPKPDCAACAVLREPHRNRLIIHTTTAASGNRLVEKSWLRGEFNKDPRAFERECLARFQDSTSGFLNSALIEKARARGVLSRPADKRNFYIAAMDPAFRRDAFGFTIVHAGENGKITQDFVARWKNDDGTPLNPGDIFPQIAQRLHEYGVRTVYSDQYNIESLQFLAQQYSFSIEEVTFSSQSKASIYANLQQLLNQDRVSLLDHPETINELKCLERRLTQGGQVQIAAPEGMHDDMATVVAIAAYEAVWLLPQKETTPPPPKTPIERIHEVVAARNKQRRYIAQGVYDD